MIDFSQGGGVLSYSMVSKNYYLSNIANLDSSLNLNLIFNNLKETRLGLPGSVPIVKIKSYPFDNKRFVIMTGRALYTMDTDALTVEQIDQSADDFVIEGNKIFWVNEDGISSLNLVFGNRSSISLAEKIDTTNAKKIGVNSNGDYIAFLNNNSELTILENNTETTTTASLGASSFSFSNDSGTLLIIDGGRTLRAYSLYEEDEDKKGIVTLITLPGTIINEVLWHADNKHIFVKDSNNDLRFIEIDDNLPINEVLISNNVGSFAYDTGKKSLYFSNPLGVWELEI